MFKNNFLVRRVVPLAICLVMLLGVLSGALFQFASAATTVTVITGSDYQPSSSTQPYNYCDAIFKNIKNNGIDPYGVIFSGDYSGGFDKAATAAGISDIKTMIKNHFGSVEQEIYSQGNHDPAGSVGLTSSGAHDTEYYGVYVINDDDYGWYSGDATSMEGMQGHLSTILKTAEKLRAYFAQKAMEGYDKPIFVASHIPLHYSFRTRAYLDGQYARYIVDALNEAGAAGLNIIYLFGHNHSGRSDDYIGGGSVYLTRGDSMFVSQIGNVNALPASVPLRFTYMNTGYVGYCANGNPGGNSLNMSIFEITGNEVVVKRLTSTGYVTVGAQGAWWTGTETANTYGTTDAYLKPATALQMKLTSNYSGWNAIDTSKYETSYEKVSTLVSGNTYVIADKDTAGTANAVKYADGDTGVSNVNVVVSGDKAYLTGVTTNEEWTWTAISGDYGIFQGVGGRSLQIAGQDNGKLRTSSDYKQTESGTRYSMWHMSSNASMGLYAYVYGSDFANTTARSYMRSNGTSFVSHATNSVSSSNTSPVSIYLKTSVATLSSTSVKVEGRTAIYVANNSGTWADHHAEIRKNLTVTAQTNGVNTVVTDYTFGDLDITKAGTYIVPVNYKGVPVGAVTVLVSSAIEAVVFDPAYYAENNADLKAAYGDDALKLYRHFASFAIKEGRPASPVFNVEYYLAKNGDLKAAFGTDNLLGYNHFKTNGYMETRLTNTAANLGDDFIAKIDMTYAELSVGISGDNVLAVSKTTAKVWHFTLQSDGTYIIKDDASGKVLDVYAGGKANSSNIGVYAPNDTEAQKWYIFENLNGTYTLRCKSGASWVLDVDTASTAAGANVEANMYNGAPTQKFNIVKVSTDMPINTSYGYAIKETANGKLLTGVKAGATAADVLKAFGDDCKILDKEGNIVTTSNLCTGYTVAKLVEGTAVNSATIIVTGDSTGDGVVGAKDIIRAKKMLAGLMNGYVESVDINGDGVLTSDDLKGLSGIVIG